MTDNETEKQIKTIRQIELGHWKSKYLFFEDKGPIKVGGKTRLFSVKNKTGNLLGYVKWMTFWRKYVFVTENVILDESCLVDIAQFVKDRTEDLKAGWKKQSVINWDIVNSWENRTDGGQMKFKFI